MTLALTVYTDTSGVAFLKLLAHDVNLLSGLINSHCPCLSKVGTGLWTVTFYCDLSYLDPGSTQLLSYVMLINNIKVHTDFTHIILRRCEYCLLYITFTKHLRSIV